MRHAAAKRVPQPLQLPAKRRCPLKDMTMLLSIKPQQLLVNDVQ